ncbi:hypothetical protein Tco_1412923 [Tanacetum coccineum]
MSTMKKKSRNTFSTEEIVPIPRESEDTSRSDSKNVLPSCEVPRNDSVTFSNPLFEFDVNFNSSDINPLFDEVLEDIECKDSYDSNLDESTFLVTPLSDSNKDGCLAPEDDIEILLHHDPSTPLKSVASIHEGFNNDPPIEENDDLFDLECKTNDEAECFEPGGDNDEIDAFLAIEVPTNEPENEPLITFSPKSDPLHHEFTGELITIPPGIVREHEDYINRMSLLCGNLSSRSPENSHTIIESLPTSTTLVEDSDPVQEEIDLFPGPDNLTPPGVENDDSEDEDNSTFFLENESSILDPLIPRPPPEPPNVCLNFKPNTAMKNDFVKLNEDFNQGEMVLSLNVEDVNSFTFFIRIFLPYLTYPKVSPLLSPPKMRTPFLTPTSPLRAGGVSLGWNFHVF